MTTITPVSAVPAKSVVPHKYIAALEGRDPIEALRKGPKRMKKLLKDYSEKALAKQPAPGKWSAKEVIAHMADGEVILGARIRFIAAMDNPPIPGYDQDRFVERLGIDKVKTKALFDAFANMRAINVALLERLPKEAFVRIGQHAERGAESIETMVTMYAGHDFIHEEQLVRTLEGEPESEADKAARKAAKQAKRDAKRADEAAKKALKAAKKKAKKAGELLASGPAEKKAAKKPLKLEHAGSGR
jgi:hypothetical protein